jgi:beta-lactamase superfamily II metal-dependent hydrolase
MNMNNILAEFGTDATVTYGASAEPVDVIENEGRKYDLGPLAAGTYQQMKVDDVIQMGPLTFTCIGPDEMAQNGRCNSDSLNFVIQYGTRRMLFTGDYAQSGEINKRHPELCKDVDVLKFPHHGGKPYEIGNIACRNVSPEYVLVPSQLNNYQIYQFIRNNGVPVERDKVLTNRAGHVVLVTDGGEYLTAFTDQNPADWAPTAE